MCDHLPCLPTPPPPSPCAAPYPASYPQDGGDTLCRQVVDDSQLSPRLKALRERELARGLDPELLRRFVLYVRRYRYPVGAAAGAGPCAWGCVSMHHAACCAVSVGAGAHSVLHASAWSQLLHERMFPACRLLRQSMSDRSIRPPCDHHPTRFDTLTLLHPPSLPPPPHTHSPPSSFHRAPTMRCP